MLGNNALDLRNEKRCNEAGTSYVLWSSRGRVVRDGTGRENRQKHNFTTCLLQSNDLCSVQQIENTPPHTPYFNACMHTNSHTIDTSRLQIACKMLCFALVLSSSTHVLQNPSSVLLCGLQDRLNRETAGGVAAEERTKKGAGCFGVPAC